jgi:hypothetical protein
MTSYTAFTTHHRGGTPRRRGFFAQDFASPIILQFETQELTYLLVCCSADKGRRALLSTGTPSHTQA